MTAPKDHMNQAPPEGRPPQGTTATPWGGWLLRGLASVGTVAVLLGVFAAGFATGRFLDDGGGSAAAAANLDAVLPTDGVTIPARWGDTLPRLVEQGVIDIEKFKAAAARSGSPLTEEQLRLLTEPSDENLRIDANNAYFMVTVLWGLGIANKNSILEQGPMFQAGWDKRGNYAATGGWILGDREGGEMVSAYELISLTPDQQATVEEIAFNSYRPCCGNATAFPDCNHGAAALGLAELMASQGASEDEIFQAVKSFNAFWFPQQYSVLATHFARQGQSWDKIDARELVSAQFSSSKGWAQVNQAVQSGGTGVPQAPSGAGSKC
jgi:hypothetical protein